MKKYILPVCLLAVMACSKKDDDTSSSATPSNTIAFTKANLVGSWDLARVEGYDITNDSLLETQFHTKGELVMVFNADNSITAIEKGDAFDYGNYEIARKNNKDYLVFIRQGWGDDSMEAAFLTQTSLVISDKPYQLSEGNDMYGKTYLSKR
jgi:hypothetical protein